MKNKELPVHLKLFVGIMPL